MRYWWTAVFLLGVVGRGSAQQFVRAVVRTTDRRPVDGALVRLLVAGTRTTTDASGEFSMQLPPSGDTLLVTAPGFRPDTLPLPAGTRIPDAVDLVRLALVLSDLVGTDSAPGALTSNPNGSWSVSGRALDGIPATIEPDISRALALVPGVSFSSFLSARPILRGLDVDDVSTTIDGFDAINLYHAGRIFSAIPALAVDRADVRFQPAPVAVGGTNAGVVDIVGRTATPGAGADLQFGEGASSADAGIANHSGTNSLFVAARTARTSLISQQLSAVGLDYDFEDLYANAHATILRLPTTVTVVASSDHLTTDSLDADGQTGRMNWSNVLVGLRTTLLHAPGSNLTASLAYARHSETGDGVGFRGVGVSVDSRFATLTGRVDGQSELAPGMVLRFGGDVIEHDVQNSVTPDDVSRGYLAVHQTESPVESGAYGDLAVKRGPLLVTSGLRVDRADGLVEAQPRINIRVTGSHQSSIVVAAGRSARLFEQLTDVQSETSDATFDFWRSAGVDGAPAATMTSMSVTAARAVGRWQIRSDLFGSRGSGDAGLKTDLMPSDSGDLYRYGHSRIRGADIAASTGDANTQWSAEFSYTLSKSERDWGAGWVPGISDRRHQARFFGSYRIGRSVHLSADLNVGSALPFTPVTSWIVVPSTQFNEVRAVNGPELSGRGTGFLRVDAAVLKSFGGPWGTRWEAGAGVSNLSWGDQAMRTDVLHDGVNGPLRNGVPGPPYLVERPGFSYNPVPSILLRGQTGAPH